MTFEYISLDGETRVFNIGSSFEKMKMEWDGTTIRLWFKRDGILATRLISRTTRKEDLLYYQDQLKSWIKKKGIDHGGSN